MGAEVSEAEIGQTVRDKLVRCRRQQHLTAATDAHQSRRSVQRRTKPVAPALLGLTDVHGHTDPHRADRTEVFRRQGALGRCRSSYGLRSRRKHSTHAVTRELEDLAIRVPHDGGHQLVVACHH